MAIARSLPSDFKYTDPFFQTGMMESIAQFTDGFNAASANAIRLVPNIMTGDYGKRAFNKIVASATTRRDITSIAAVESLKFTQDEEISVKLHRKFGPVAYTLTALRHSGITRDAMNRFAGQQFGEEKVQQHLNAAIIAVEAAIEGQTTALTYDATGQSTKTLLTEYLAAGLQKMGDHANRVRAWVMHSKPFYDLVKSQITTTGTVFSGFSAVINAATPASLGRPVIVTDASALTDANGSLTDTYNILGLVEDAVVIEESEEEIVQISDPLTGFENIHIDVQAEYAFNVSCKGFKYNTSGGGANPTDGTLGTTSNWTQAATADKHLAGIRIIVQ